MGEARDPTVFIDVTAVNTFSGLLDQFAKELQNDNADTTTNQQDANKNISNKEIKTETTCKPDDRDNGKGVTSIVSNQTHCNDKQNNHQNERIRCPECHRYTAENEEIMTRHIRKVHRGENPFLCYMCDYSTYNKILFEEHVRIHQGIKPYKCSFCPHKSVSKKNLKKHELIHRPDNPLKCTRCDHIARHRKGLAYHTKRFHTNIEDAIMCTKCNDVFYNPQHLAEHIREEKMCDECDHTACSLSLLETHKESEHGKPKTRNKNRRGDLFRCGVCEWSSCIKSRILLHLIHHPNQIVDEGVIDISILKKHGIM